MRYLVTVGDETLELELERSPDGSYRVRGSAGPELRVSTLAHDSGLVSLLVDGQTVEVQPAAGEVRFRQQRFPVRAQSWLERAVTRSGAGSGAQSKKLLAAMPGRIVRVLCEVGALVQEGSPLIVMEAMKMQNELCAKTSAVVRAVRVSVGQTVDRGELLVEFE